MAMTKPINDKETIEYLLQADPVLGAKGETMRCRHDCNLQEAHREIKTRANTRELISGKEPHITRNKCKILVFLGGKDNWLRNVE